MRCIEKFSSRPVLLLLLVSRCEFEDDESCGKCIHETLQIHPRPLLSMLSVCPRSICKKRDQRFEHHGGFVRDCFWIRWDAYEMPIRFQQSINLTWRFLSCCHTTTGQNRVKPPCPSLHQTSRGFKHFRHFCNLRRRNSMLIFLNFDSKTRSDLSRNQFPQHCTHFISTDSVSIHIPNPRFSSRTSALPPCPRKGPRSERIRNTTRNSHLPHVCLIPLLPKPTSWIFFPTAQCSTSSPLFSDYVFTFFSSKKNLNFFNNDCTNQEIYNWKNFFNWNSFWKSLLSSLSLS